MARLDLPIFGVLLNNGSSKVNMFNQNEPLLHFLQNDKKGVDLTL